MIKILLLNIKDYGLKNILLIIIFEMFYYFNSKYRRTLFFDDSSTSKYETFDQKEMNENSSYDSPYLPTPFYFLVMYVI